MRLPDNVDLCKQKVKLTCVPTGVMAIADRVCKVLSRADGVVPQREIADADIQDGSNRCKRGENRSHIGIKNEGTI